MQEYCSETSHIWDGFCLLGNRRAMTRLPDLMQQLVRQQLRGSVLAQRADGGKLNAGLRATSKGKDMMFVATDKDAFRMALQRSIVHADWKGKSGDAAWSALQAVSGALG